MFMLLCAKNISGSRNKELETDLLGRGIGWTGHEVGRWRFTFPCFLFDTFEFYIVHYSLVHLNFILCVTWSKNRLKSGGKSILSLVGGQAFFH